MSQKIVIVSQSHLCKNPRVLKESLALIRAGYDVTILTAVYSEGLLSEDLDLLRNTSIAYQFYSDLRKPTTSTVRQRAVRWLFTFLKQKIGLESKLSLGFNFYELKAKCLKLKADLYIMHQEMPTILGAELSGTLNVAFDIEDWYSEDLLLDARDQRPLSLLKRAEKAALGRSAFTSTTAEVMARELAKHYHISRVPNVIYNSFPLVENSHQRHLIGHKKRLYWFSQTIGPGRGLEFFIQCTARSNHSWELILRGNTDEKYTTSLRTLMHPKDTLVILPSIRISELLSDLTSYDFGLALEPSEPLNKSLTISNKFFHYLSAGLPVIASDTLGQQEIANKHPDIIFLYKNNDADSLIEVLDRVGYFDNKELEGIRQQVKDAYTASYLWKYEEKKLLELVKHACRPNS